MITFGPPIFFVNLTFMEAVAKLNINLIDPSAFASLKKVLAVNDIGHAVVVDKTAREILDLQDFNSQQNLFNSLTSQSNLTNEFVTHITPMYNSADYQEKVRGELRVREDSSNIMDDFSRYRLAVVQGVLLVGCEDEFFSTFDNKASALKFYRNCLELCQSTIPGKDLNHSVLFSKFVKLSIST